MNVLVIPGYIFTGKTRVPVRHILHSSSPITNSTGAFRTMSSWQCTLRQAASGVRSVYLAILAIHLHRIVLDFRGIDDSQMVHAAAGLEGLAPWRFLEAEKFPELVIETELPELARYELQPGDVGGLQICPSCDHSSQHRLARGSSLFLMSHGTSRRYAKPHRGPARMQKWRTHRGREKKAEGRWTCRETSSADSQKAEREGQSPDLQLMIWRRISSGSSSHCDGFWSESMAHGEKSERMGRTRRQPEEGEKTAKDQKQRDGTTVLSTTYFPVVGK